MKRKETQTNYIVGVNWTTSSKELEKNCHKTYNHYDAEQFASNVSEWVDFVYVANVATIQICQQVVSFLGPSCCNVCFVLVWRKNYIHKYLFFCKFDPLCETYEIFRSKIYPICRKVASSIHFRRFSRKRTAHTRNLLEWSIPIRSTDSSFDRFFRFHFAVYIAVNCVAHLAYTKRGTNTCAYYKLLNVLVHAHASYEFKKLLTLIRSRANECAHGPAEIVQCCFFIFVIRVTIDICSQQFHRLYQHRKKCKQSHCVLCIQSKPKIGRRNRRFLKEIGKRFYYGIHGIVYAFRRKMTICFFFTCTWKIFANTFEEILLFVHDHFTTDWEWIKARWSHSFDATTNVRVFFTDD